MPPKKDPNKPKGRTTAYAFFLKDRRSIYKERGEDVEFGAFTKECSELWKKHSDADKEKFFKQAEGDKTRYEEEMSQYVPSDGYGAKKGRAGKKAKDPNKPKRAMSAFFFFSGDKRGKLKADDPSLKVGEIAKQLGAAWNIMSAKQKAPYEKQAKEDRKRYDEDMTRFREGLPIASAKTTKEVDEEDLFSEED